MPGPAFRHGDRVTLRTVEREDVDFLHRARTEPSIREGLTFDRPASRDDVEDFFDETVRSEGNCNLLACVDGDPAGAVVLFDVDRHAAEIAYWFVPEHRGEGYATEAAAMLVDHGFSSLGLHRVRAKALEWNDASRRLLGRLGFEREGVRRECVFQRGEYRDHVTFGLLRREWDGVDAVLD